MIQVNWDNSEKTVIRLDYFAPIASWDEYQNAVKDSFEMAKSQSHIVHFIHNPGSAAMPAGNAIAQIRRAISSTPSNAGGIYMAIHDDFARRVLQVVIRLTVRSKLQFFFVSSVDEARKVIAIQREKALTPQ